MSRRDPGEVSAQFSLLSLPPGDAFVFLPRSHFPPLWLPFRSSFSRSSRVSSIRRCYFRASVLCKCRTRIKVAISTRSPIGQVIVWGIINLTLCPINPLGRTRIFSCERLVIYVCVQEREIYEIVIFAMNRAGVIVIDDQYR